MLTLEILKHYVLSRRAGSLVRTISRICVGAIGIGVFSLIVVISVMNGFNNSLKSRLLAVEPHLVIKADSSRPKTFWNDLLQELNRRPGTKAYYYDSQDVIVRTVDGYIGGGVARGMSADALKDVLMRVMQKQKASPDPDVRLPVDTTQLKPGEILMGVDLAVNLGVFEGSEVVMIDPEALLLPKGEVPKYERLKVTGILSTNVAEVDSKMIYYVRGQSLAHLKDSASREEGIEVRFDDADEAMHVQKELQKENVASETWMQRNSALFHALWLEKTAIGLFLCLSALIASFPIVSVLMLLMAQKRRDLGILMALGMSQKRTLWVFTQIGLILSITGLAGGLLLGLFVSLFLSHYPLNVLPEIYHDRSIPVAVNFGFVLLVALVGVGIVFVSSWLPARRNTLMSPAEALRGGSEN